SFCSATARTSGKLPIVGEKVGSAVPATCPSAPLIRPNAHRPKKTVRKLGQVRRRSALGRTSLPWQGDAIAPNLFSARLQVGASRWDGAGRVQQAGRMKRDVQNAATVAPLHAARTAQRAVPTTWNRYASNLSFVSKVGMAQKVTSFNASTDEAR